MTRTTPPRPLDVTVDFPELVAYARTAVRLHPRAGTPTSVDSSVGGPLLWPADEPWPTCDEHVGEPIADGTALADVWRRRDLWEVVRTRRPSAAERAELERIGGTEIRIDTPVAMLPVAQLRAGDVPALPCPDGTDLLQVLWCPCDHPDLGYSPRTELRWRAAADVTDPLTVPPVPEAVGIDEYVVSPCVVDPEPVTEYPAPLELPDDLSHRIRARESGWQDGREVGYQSDLAVAPGWKVGGWGPWSFNDPEPMRCPECGAEARPLLTVASGDNWTGSWQVVEDRDLADSNPPEVTIGRGYNLQIYVCTASATHPHLQHMQ